MNLRIVENNFIKQLLNETAKLQGVRGVLSPTEIKLYFLSIN